MWVWMLGSMAWASGVEIVVGGPGEVVVRASADPVHIASCRGVLWELFNPETNTFEPAMTKMCEDLKPALRVDQNGQPFRLDAMLPPLPDVGFHVVRPVVVYGSKCNDKLPFAVSDCRSIDAVHGPQIVVRNRGAAVPIAVPNER